MRKIEFIANAENDQIKIPKKYLGQIGSNFKVIIVPNDSEPVVKKRRQLTAVQITTNDLVFNRDEANLK